jgi:2-acylglycerol O-acyltransferase 2
MSSVDNSPSKNTNEKEAKASPSKSIVDRLPHIDFAPLDIPLHRRLQTLSTMFIPFWMVISFILIVAMVFVPVLWPFAIAYFVFIYFDKAPEQGGRRQNWFRNLKVFKYQADFFQTYIHRETKLDPSKNYIFGYHPHGFIGYGAQICFGTEAVNVSKLFTGLTIHPLTLSVNFNIPFHRELLMMLGVCSVSKPSINYILNSGPGKSCLIVVGGAQEALHAAPDKAELVLENRMGFVKIAMQNG